MEEINSIVESFSVEALVVGLITFIVTMYIRKRIKKRSSNLEESKRKLVNSVLVIIPLMVSVSISVGYLYYIEEMEIYRVIDIGCSGWLVSMSIYAVYERSGIVLNGLFSGKQELVNEEVSSVLKVIKQKEKTMKTVKKKMEELMDSKSKVTSLSRVLEINRELNVCSSQLATLSKEIEEMKEGR